MADNRRVMRDGRADQFQHGWNPGQIIIYAHRPAHEAKPAVGSRRDGYRITGIRPDQRPGNPAGVEECGKIARSLAGTMTKDGDGLGVWIHADSFRDLVAAF